LIRSKQAADDIEQRAFAAAARSDQAQKLAAANIQRRIAESVNMLIVSFRAKVVGHIPDADRDAVRVHVAAAGWQDSVLVLVDR